MGVSCVDELIIGQIGQHGPHHGPLRQLAHGRWCNDGSAGRIDRPGIDGLHHNTVMLTIGTIGSLATLCLAEVDDRLQDCNGADRQHDRIVMEPSMPGVNSPSRSVVTPSPVCQLT